jgi:hypothetical protein
MPIAMLADDEARHIREGVRERIDAQGWDDGREASRARIIGKRRKTTQIVAWRNQVIVAPP